MATEAELTELLRGLEDLLTEAGLSFVVDQERVLAVEGVAAPTDDRAAEGRQFSARADVGPSGVHRMKGSDAVRRPLSTGERVAVLLDLIEVASAGTVEIEAMV